jgi:hypothetical protein
VPGASAWKPSASGIEKPHSVHHAIPLAELGYPGSIIEATLER